MSAASSARTQVRDDATHMSAPARAPQAATAPKAKKSAFGFAGADSEDHFKLNLNDIPQLPRTMEVEGFKPSLLARLVGLVVRN